MDRLDDQTEGRGHPPPKGEDRWHACWQVGGADALRSQGLDGPTRGCRTSSSAKSSGPCWEGATAKGFDNDLWTLEQVDVVITQLTGVRYHPGHVWVALHHRLGWTLQRPELCFHLQQPSYTTD